MLRVSEGHRLAYHGQSQEKPCKLRRSREQDRFQKGRRVFFLWVFPCMLSLDVRHAGLVLLSDCPVGFSSPHHAIFVVVEKMTFK